MKKFYSPSLSDATVLSKPSMGIRLVFMVLFVCLFSIVTNAQILQRGLETTQDFQFTGTGRTIVINKPIGVVAGDILIANIVQNETDNDNGGLSDILNSGWTLISRGLIHSNGTANDDNSWWETYLYRIADGTEGTSFSFAIPYHRADMAIGTIVPYSRVTTTGGNQPNGTPGGPFDVAISAFSIGNSNQPMVNGLMTATPNAAVLL